MEYRLWLLDRNIEGWYVVRRDVRNPTQYGTGYLREDGTEGSGSEYLYSAKESEAIRTREGVWPQRGDVLVRPFGKDWNHPTGWLWEIRSDSHINITGFPSQAGALECAGEWILKQEGKVRDMRSFESGTIRDTSEGKLDYYKALSPIVTRGYVEYLGRHRTMPDGSVRDWDNWKKGMPDEVCMSSLVRHTKDLELVMDGFEAEDNHGPCNKKDLLYAIMFNASAILHQELESESAETKS